MASSGATNRCAATISSALPSLFKLNTGSINGNPKDLENIIGINEHALSQQIEFILQDSPMEQEDTEIALRMAPNYNPPKSIITNACAYNSKHSKKTNPECTETPNMLYQHHHPRHAHPQQLPRQQSQQQTQHQPEPLQRPQQLNHRHHRQQQHLQQLQDQQHILSARRTIMQSTDAAIINADNIKQEDDPELNDENLQDIEEEAQAAEADEEPESTNHHVRHMQYQLMRHHIHPNIKLENHDHNGEALLEYIHQSALSQAHHAHLAESPTSTVSYAPRSVEVSVSEALEQLQRRPVFFNNPGSTYVRIPAAYSRSPMTLLNAVQQAIPVVTPTTQLILQPENISGDNQTTATSVVSSNSSLVPMRGSATTISPDISEAITSTTSTMSQTESRTKRYSPHLNNVTTKSGSGVTPILQNNLNQNNNKSHIQNNTTNINNASNITVGTSISVLTTTSNNTSSSVSTSSMKPTTYQCAECVEKFDSKELFDIHRSGHANNMKCAICNMVLKSLKNYEKHCLRCKPYECQICGRVVRFRPNFIKHMRVHTGQQSERHKYKCEVCHKEFMSFEYFKVHKKIHNENVNLTCEICGKVFSALASLRGHSKLHSGVKLHNCDVCGKGFGQRYNLKIHARTHTGDFPFECTICKKKMHTQSSLQTHMQIHQYDQATEVATTSIKYEQSSPSSTSSTASITAVNNCTITSNSVDATKTIIKIEPQKDMETDDYSENSYDHVDRNNCDDNKSNRTSTTATNRCTAVEDSSNESSNTSQELQQEQARQQQYTHPYKIAFKNSIQQTQEQHVGEETVSHQPAKVIQNSRGSNSCNNIKNNILAQQFLRKTPIIQSTGEASNLSTNVMQRTTGIPPLSSPSSSSASCSSSVADEKSPTGVIFSLTSAVNASSRIIRSTRNYNSQQSTIAALSQNTSEDNHRSSNVLFVNRNNHRNHHRRRHLADIDEDDDEEDKKSLQDVKLQSPIIEQQSQQLKQSKQMHDNRHSITNSNRDFNHQNHHRQHNFDEDDDDDKSSPSLATAAIIKVEPNLYSSGSGDNSNDIFIKEEVMFEDSSTPQSPQSPTSSKFRISNFDSDLVDHNVDLNHSLPPYGNLFEPHSMPDTIPVQLYPDDDDDFRLDHSSIGGLHNTSSSTNDGDYIKKEWTYGTSGGNYVINGKFDDDSNALCDAANFIYN